LIQNSRRTKACGCYKDELILKQDSEDEKKKQAGPVKEKEMQFQQPEAKVCKNKPTNQ